jgi:hypothetical protein
MRAESWECMSSETTRPFRKTFPSGSEKSWIQQSLAHPPVRRLLTFMLANWFQKLIRRLAQSTSV